MDREKKGGREPWADADIERDRGGREERPGKQEENQVRGQEETVASCAPHQMSLP